MSDTETKVSKIILRNDTAENLQSSTEVLALAEPCFDTTNRILKIGDGVNLWKDLEAFGTHKEASVKTGTFYGNGENFISINIGKIPLKKIFISIDTTGVISTPKGTVLSMLYDSVAGEKTITYQGNDAHYVGTHSGSQLTANYSKNGDNYIYTFGYRSSNDPTYYDKFASGCKYTYIATLSDVLEPPTGTINIAQNGNGIDVSAYAFANVNVQSSGDLNEDDSILYVTKYAEGIYTTGASDVYLGDININIGFKPKIFLFVNDAGIDTKNTNKYALLTSILVSDNNYNILFKRTSGIYYGSSQGGRSLQTKSSSNTFDLTENGVQGGDSTTVYVKGGGFNFSWYAWG